MIDFNGIDILDGDIDDATLHRGLACALTLPENRVRIIHDISDYPERGTADAVGVVSSIEGDFPLLLSVQATPLQLAYDDALGPIREFCSTTGARCLVPDDEHNPYTMWLVSPDRRTQSVSLDPAALDNERYVLR